MAETEEEKRRAAVRRALGLPLELGNTTVRAAGTEELAPIQVRAGVPNQNDYLPDEDRPGLKVTKKGSREMTAAESARAAANVRQAATSEGPGFIEKVIGAHSYPESAFRIHPGISAAFASRAPKPEGPEVGSEYEGPTEGVDAADARTAGGGGGGVGGGAAGPGIAATGQTYDLVDPKRRGYYENAADEQQAASRDIAMADMQKRRDTGEAAGEAARFFEDEQARQAAVAKANKAYQETLLSNINSASEEMAKQKIDSKRMWKNMSTGQSLAFGIAAIVQGISSARQGKDNPVLTQMQADIDRDIDAQKHDIMNGHKRVEDMKGLYAEAVKLTGDYDKATTAARYMALNAIEQKLKEKMAASDVPEVAARYRLVATQMEQAKQGQLMQMEKYVDPRLAALMAQGGGGGGMSKHDEESTRHLSDKLSALGLPGLSQAISDYEQASSVSGPMGRIERYIYHVPGVGPMVTGDKKIATEQALTNLHDQFNRMITGAGQSEQEAERRWRTVVGDGSPAAIQRGLGMIQKFAAENEAVLRSGASDKVNAEYNRRMGTHHPNAEKEALLKALGANSAPAKR